MIGRADDADVGSAAVVIASHARVLRGLEATIEDLGAGTARGAEQFGDGAHSLVSGDGIELRTATLVYYLVMPNDTTLG